MPVVEFYMPKIDRVTKKARLNLYRMLKSSGVFRDKAKVGYFISYLNGEDKIKIPKKWRGVEPSKKQLRYLYWLIFRGDFSKEQYKKILYKYFERR